MGVERMVNLIGMKRSGDSVLCEHLMMDTIGMMGYMYKRGGKLHKL
jgi:hypothetical protein